ncbi:MAG: hypothetical protein ACR2RF_06160 [Geminicoccaceae bacterium]
MELISINEAAAQGIERIRQPNWSNPNDYLKIDIVEDKPGPWLHLYSPINEPICKQKNPQDILWILEGGAEQADAKEFVRYEGKIDPDETPSAPLGNPDRSKA